PVPSMTDVIEPKPEPKRDDDRDHNLYTLLRGGFPSDLQRCCIQTADGRVYRWSEVEHASAALANLMVGLGLAPGDRVAVQVDKSPEALLLYLATLRSGCVF